MWDAQLIWLNRLQGISLSTWPSAEYDEHFTGYNIYFLQQCEDFVRFVETRTDSYFEGTCFYKALNGTSYQTMNWQIILHCMNHSTYHRGQLVTMLRNLGVEDLPATDYIQFVREQQKSIL